MPRRRISPLDPAFTQLTLAAVGLEFGLPELCDPTPRRRTKQIVFARQVAMYLAATGFNMTTTRTAEMFGRDRSTVSHALGVVEDSRDDAVFNRKLEKVEVFLDQCRESFGVGV
jgi:hypothetical protein